MAYEGQEVQGHNYIHETGLLYNLNRVRTLYMYLAVGDNSTLYIKTLYAYACRVTIKFFPTGSFPGSSRPLAHLSWTPPQLANINIIKIIIFSFLMIKLDRTQNDTISMN